MAQLPETEGLVPGGGQSVGTVGGDDAVGDDVRVAVERSLGVAVGVSSRVRFQMIRVLSRDAERSMLGLRISQLEMQDEGADVTSPERSRER